VVLLRGVRLVLALLLCTSVSSRGAELPFRHLLSDHDAHILSSASIQKLHQDRSGYVWMGFYSTGLSRYNGDAAVEYGLADGLPDLTVRIITEDTAGHLWVGTDTGIVISDRPLAEYGRGERIRFTSRVGETELVRSRTRRHLIVAGDDGSTWVGTPSQGLIRYLHADGSLHHEQFAADLDGDGTPDQVHSVTVRRDGSEVWASIGNNRILILGRSGDGWDAAVLEQGAPNAAVTAWLEDSEGNLWAGGVDGSIWRLRAGTRMFEETPSLLSGGLIVDIVETPAADIWIASIGAGVVRLARHDPSQQSRYTRKDGLLSDTVWSILLDHENTLWFAQNGGVSRLMSDFEAFTVYTSRLPDRSTFAALPPSAGSPDQFLWVGTGGGLAAISEEGEVATLTIDDGLLHNSVYTLSRDEKERLWVGTVGGLSLISFTDAAPPAGAALSVSHRIHGRRAQLTSYPFQIAYSIRQLPLRVSGEAGVTQPVTWIAGQSGVRIFGSSRSWSLRQLAGLPATGAVDAAVDDDGFLWVGTSDQGLFRTREPLTIERLESLPTRPDAEFGMELVEPLLRPVWTETTGAPTNGIRNLLWSGGRLWAGTTQGLAVFDRGSTTPVMILDSTNGLGGDTIVGVAESNDGRTIWVSQNAGLARVDKARLVVTRRVTSGDGLLADEAWAYHSVEVAPDGTVYFATPKGLSIYRPWLDSPVLSRPLLTIERADIHQGFSGHRESLFEFAPLSYVNEQEVVYRTRLRGFDEGWSSPTKETRIRYTNLPAFVFSREYTFEVMARSGDGVWTEPVRLSFDALPRWWERWWALLIWGLLFTTILVAYNRFRTYQLAVQNVRLEQMVNERTAEIAAQAMEIDTLDRIVQVINREVEFERVLGAVLEQGMILFPEAQKGATLILDHEHGTIGIPSAKGYDPEVLSKIRFSATDAEKRYASAGVEIDEGIHLIRSLDELPGVTDVAGVPPPLSMMAMAITIEERIEAYLIFENFDHSNAFDHMSLRTLRRYREHARTAVAKALILRELEIRNREAQRANEAKSTFLANMSHELRTPLNSIIGFSELLVERLGAQIDERYRHFLRLILSSGQHLLEIINDILDLSKVEAGKMQLFMEPFDVSSAVEGVNQVMKPVASKKDIEIVSDVSPEMPRLESDPGKFKQILYNLVSNAVKFSEPGDRVVVRGRYDATNQRMVFEVEDEGIGIPPDQIESIFDEFKQVDGAVSRRFEGTGLGLSLVRKFVNFLGGGVEAKSRFGEGSIFTFWLPATIPATSDGELRVVEKRRPPPTRGRVLIVTDRDPAYESIQEALAEHGLSTVRAVTAEQALRLVKTVEPDVMTLDLSHFGNHGRDVLAELKRDREGSSVPTLVVGSEEQNEQARALGAEECLVGPVEFEQLANRLQRLLKERRRKRVQRLLIVDGDEVIHSVVGTFLRDAGYEVFTARSGANGIVMANATNPDAVILDLVLPDISGVEVALSLRDNEATRDLPVVIFTSGEVDGEDLRRLDGQVHRVVKKGSGARSALLDAIERLIPESLSRTVA
jgi:signal transduction histidine kinase/DNA-binding response OmpR family regulator/ligand-binding sensor domain-containing protein